MLSVIACSLTAWNKSAIVIANSICFANKDKKFNSLLLTLSLEENTIQLFAIDKCGKEGLSKQLNYKEPKIGRELPVEVTEISSYDEGAAFLD